MPDTQCLRRCSNFNCLNIVLTIIGILFFFTLGLIIGAVFSATFLAALPVIITAAVILAILFILFYIIKRCNK